MKDWTRCSKKTGAITKAVDEHYSLARFMPTSSEIDALKITKSIFNQDNELMLTSTRIINIQKTTVPKFYLDKLKLIDRKTADCLNLRLFYLIFSFLNRQLIETILIHPNFLYKSIISRAKSKKSNCIH